MIPCAIEKTIEPAMRTFPAVLITGPGKSGKTTLLRARFSESHGFVSLENPDVRERVIDDPVGFVKHHPPPIILDGIQYTPAFFHYIKSAFRIDTP